jgi:hypothetical protein
MSPSRVDRGGLADDAEVELLAALFQLLADDHGAVDARAFLVAGDQQAMPMGRIGMCGQELLHRHREGGDRGLHVGRAAAVQLAVAVAGHEGVAGPLLQRAGGHDVGVAGEHQRAAAAADGAWPRGW